MSIPQNMLAAILVEPERLQVREVPTPKPGPEDVLIQVEACAVCSSDVSLMRDPWPGQPPFGHFIPGHEYAGEVVAVGNTVDEVTEGDRVAVEVHFGCTRCINCRIGNYTACLNWGDMSKGHRANGMTTNGGFAQYVVNHISTIHRIPDWVSYEEASLVTNLGCVLYGFETFGGYIVGDRVAVIGEGPLGLISVQVAKLLGAEIVWLVGIDKSHLEVGKTLGADKIIDATQQDPLDMIMRETEGVGVEIAIEASGSKEGLRTAVKLPRWMGKILLLGIPESMTDVDFHNLARGNKSIYTVRGEGWSNCRRGVSLLRQKRINLYSLVTHSFPLSRIDEAFRTHVQKLDSAIKVVVKPNEK
jgi:threonine dehydrogenase-like Zn-dependent dehydrogenase